MKKEIKIPDIAENVETGTIASILVSVGDKITVDQPLVEVETEKASTDIPSLFDGVVAEIKIQEGDEVSVNQVIMIIETEEKEEEEDSASEKEKSEADKPDDKFSESDQEEEENEGDEEPEKEDESSKKDEKEEKEKGKTINLADIPAAPSVRRLAREMDVDLTKVKASGPGDRVTADDVKKHAETSDDAKTKGQKQEAIKTDEFEQWGSVTAEKIKTIRKITARNVSESWQSIPHVTHFDEADLTKLEEFRLKYQQKVEKDGVKITITSLLLKICGYALQKFPKFNSSITGEEIIYKHYYHIGVAVDTPRGLLVPVIRDVNSKSLIQLSAELDELAKKARDKKINPDEMQGGSFTISNLGGIGGTGFTPIVLPPQVAILGVSRASWRAVYLEE